MSGKKQQVSIAYTEVLPQMTAGQQCVCEQTNHILVKRCAESGLSVALTCDLLVTNEDLAPDLSKIEILDRREDYCPARRRKHKAFANAKAGWESRQHTLTERA